MAKKEVKKAAPKKAVKAAPKKAAPKKAAPKKAEPKSDGKYYSASKNAETGMWEVRLAQTKGAAGKVISKFKTKPEAESYINGLTAKNGRKAVIHNSKGAAKGRAKKVK